MSEFLQISASELANCSWPGTMGLSDIRGGGDKKGEGAQELPPEQGKRGKLMKMAKLTRMNYTAKLKKAKKEGS